MDITPVNDAPTTSAVTLAPIAEDSGPRLITQAELLANAADIDGPSLTAIDLVISSGAGSLVNNGDGSWTYTPSMNDDTGVTFGYTVFDGSLSAGGSATLDIKPVNDAPTTRAVTLAPIAEDSGPRLITQAELLGNAVDVDGPGLIATNLVISSGAGSLVDNGDGSWTYAPALDDDSGVSFGYAVSDGSLSTLGSATLDITPVNDAPTTSAVTLAPIAEDSGPRLITQAELLANAADIDGPSLTAIDLVISSGAGSLVNNGDGTWNYMPALNDDSGVTFGYSVTDGSLNVAGSATLDLTPVNDAPTTSIVTLVPIAEDSGTRLITQAELLAEAADVDGPGLAAINLAIGSGAGALVDNGDGSWTYTAAADDDRAVSFSYIVTDGSLSVDGIATLDITPVNDAPTTRIVSLAPVAEDSGPRLITQAELLANAADVDGPSLTAINLVISSGAGSLTDNGNGTWTYMPALDDDSAVGFSYVVTDGSLSVDGIATLDIAPINDAPTTSIVTLAPIAEDSGPRLITQAELLANAADVDGPGLTAINLLISNGSGSLVDHGNGSWTFTPALDDDGAVAFTYAITDGHLSVAGSAMLDITPVDDAPLVSLAPLELVGGASIRIDSTLLNARDVDTQSAQLRFIVNAASNGRFETLAAPGTAITQFSLTDVSAGQIVFVSTSALESPSFSLVPYDGNTYGSTVIASIDFRRTVLAVRSTLADPLLSDSSDQRSLIDAPAAFADGRVSARFGNDREGSATLAANLTAIAGRDLKIQPAPLGIALLEPAQIGIERAASSSGAASAATAAGPRRATTDYLDVSARVAADDYVASLDGFMMVDMLQLAGPGSRGNGEAVFGPGPQSADDDGGGGLTLSDAARASAIALTAGTVWWALRAGSLLTGLLVSLPAWRQADLLAVLPDEEDDDVWDQPEDHESARDERAVALVFESPGNQGVRQ